MALPELSYRAERDIEEIALDIADDSPRASQRFRKVVRKTLDTLAEQPGLGGIYFHGRHPDLRALPLPGFRRYVVFYERTDQGIYVVRILHGARDIPQLLDHS